MKEKWKDIKGYEGLYQISNYGNLRGLDRYITENNTNKKRHIKSKIIKPVVNNSGYHEVCLRNKNKEKKHHRIHRLVAEAFIPNPNNLPIINHKDKNKINNNVRNLEWCTYKYNNNYKKTTKPCWYKGVKVNQYDKDMNYIKTYNSMYEIERKYNVTRTSIRYCCLGKNKTCRGYVWRYADEDKQKQNN